jgi:hypothetical protein
MLGSRRLPGINVSNDAEIADLAQVMAVVGHRKSIYLAMWIEAYVLKF